MTNKLLCLDYGEKRVGVAVSLDAMVFPRPALMRGTRQEFFERLLALIEAEGPSALVLGLPLCRDGSDSLTTRRVRNFAKSLARRSTVPIYFMDEALSSTEAEALLRESGHKSRSANRELRQEGVIDSVAAVGILQSYLNLAPEKRRRAFDT